MKNDNDLFSVGSDFHPGLSQSLHTLRMWYPFTLWNEIWSLWVSFLLLSVCVFIFFYGMLQNIFFLGFILFSQSFDHAKSSLSWANFSPKLCRCEDGKTLIIGFSEQGLNLSYFFTTWTCQDRVYPQKLIAYLLHIFQSIHVTKGKVFSVFLFVINWVNRLLVLIIYYHFFIGRKKKNLLFFLCPSYTSLRAFGL